jgi:hypothetical protein
LDHHRHVINIKTCRPHVNGAGPNAGQRIIAWT